MENPTTLPTVDESAGTTTSRRPHIACWHPSPLARSTLWQAECCPAWCGATHRDRDPVEDRAHWLADPLTVPLSRHDPVVNGMTHDERGEWAPAAPRCSR
jgi:hypothetical protein